MNEGNKEEGKEVEIVEMEKGKIYINQKTEEYKFLRGEKELNEGKFSPEINLSLSALKRQILNVPSRKDKIQVKRYDPRDFLKGCLPKCCFFQPCSADDDQRVHGRSGPSMSCVTLDYDS